MFGIGLATKVYVAVGSTDMRKGFEGLYGLVRERLGVDPLSGHLFLFANASANAAEGSGVGRQRVMGMCQAFGEGPIPLAECQRRSAVCGAEPGGVEFAVERHGPGACEPASLVSS